MNEDVVKLKFSFQIPKGVWLRKFTKKYPLLHFNLLSVVSLGLNQGNCLIQIKGIEIKNFWDELSNFQGDTKFNLIYKDDNTILVNILVNNSWINIFIDDPWIFQNPVKIYKGKISIEFISPRNKIEKMFKNPRWKNVDITIDHIGRYCPDSLLTPKQTNILLQTLRNGFYNIPRNISLSSLASDLGLSPSGLSENIRRINKKLGEQYLGYHRPKK